MSACFSYRLPGEIFFGIGEGKRTGEYVKRFSTRFLLVTGQHSVRRFGILDEVTESLAQEGVSWEIFDQVEPEPSLETVDRALDRARLFGAEGVISLGGGSVLDCGKTVAALLQTKSSVKPFFDGQSPPQTGSPWIALPTTAGTGSEMTNNAVLSDPVRKLKKSIRGSSLLARLVIVEPHYTEFMDSYLTAACGVDALVQAIEAMTSPHSNPVGDVLALEAVRLLWTYLPQAVSRGNDRTVREYVARGSLLSAMAFSNASSGPAHGLSHMIGPELSIVHGEACGLLLPHVIRYNREVLSERYEQIAQAVFFNQDAEHASVERLIEAWSDFLKKTGLRSRLRDFGVTEAQLTGVVREELIGRNIKENPRTLNQADLVDLLREAL